LGHVGKRRAGLAREAVAVAEAAIQPVDDVLHHRLDRVRQEPRRAPGDAAATRLVSRKGRLVEEQHARTRPGEVAGGHRACRPGAENRNVVGRHGGNGNQVTTRAWNVRREKSARPIEPPTSANMNAQTGMCGSDGVSEARRPSVMYTSGL